MIKVLEFYEGDWSGVYGDDGRLLFQGHLSDGRLFALDYLADHPGRVVRRPATDDEEHDAMLTGRAPAEYPA